MNNPKSRYLFFPLIVFSADELPADKKWELSGFLRVWKNPSSRVNGCHLLFSSLSFCIHFLSCSCHFACSPVHVAFISFHLAFMSFHVPSQCIQDTGLRKPVRWGSAQMLTFLLSFSYHFAGLYRSPSSGFMNMYIYKPAIVTFLLSFSVPETNWQC